jgi:hypothetical protein
MTSPFPGMDPYLEGSTLWPEFHSLLIKCLYKTLTTGLLVDKYQTLIKGREYQTEGVSHHEDYLEIHSPIDGSLLTWIDIISPTNKTTDVGRQAYLKTRNETRNIPSNLVEIELSLQGKPLMDYSREGLPDWDYGVTVARATNLERMEIYTSTLEKRLPRFRLPLQRDDRDAVIDLQSQFSCVYSEANFAARINYSQEPGIPLTEDQRVRLDKVLTMAKFRQPMPTQEKIALVAYLIWKADGQPHGHDKEHWYKALEILKCVENAGQIDS